MTRTFWLSFCDNSRPAGQQFLGVAVVDVDEGDIAEAKAITASRYPDALDGAEVIGAALRKAHRTGCNPGGEVQTAEITGAPETARAPRHQLLSKADLERLDLL